ncbi:MAG TPA: YciI-like protein [Candidatus Acidoferrales bacterium]|nr:YciI-like protein [Candidatus Acidoferrales bacterium]
MHYILFYEVVDAFTSKRGPFRAKHLSHAREAFERGELVMAGALADPADGAVLVFRGASAEPAENFARQDPYVVNGLVTSWRVRKWTTVIGDGASLPDI